MSANATIGIFLDVVRIWPALSIKCFSTFSFIWKVPRNVAAAAAAANIAIYQIFCKLTALSPAICYRECRPENRFVSGLFSLSILALLVEFYSSLELSLGDSILDAFSSYLSNS